MFRRHLPTLWGAGLAGLAGCVSDQENEQTTPTGADAKPSKTTDSTSPTTTSETDSPTATPHETELAVELDALQPAIVEINVDYLKIVSGGQFLYLDVSVESDPAPSLEDLAFRFDGDNFTPIQPKGDQYIYRALVEKDQYDAAGTDAAGWVLFELPRSGDASDAALVWPGGEWRPDEQLRAQLAARTPLLTLEEWKVPEAVPNSSNPTFEFTVR